MNVKRRRKAGGRSILRYLFFLLLMGLSFGAGVWWWATIPNATAVQATKLTDETSAFIEKIAPIAQEIGAEHDLYPSVILAQAILESHSGTSGLALDPSYNLFGIKGEYMGQSVVLQTLEDDGKGNLSTIHDKFRAYPSWRKSLEEYAAVLDQPMYNGVHKTKTSSYLEATLFLTGRYATDTSYHSKLRTIINDYNLLKYDGIEVSQEEGNVWNPYRRSFTSKIVFEQDENWIRYLEEKS